MPETFTAPDNVAAAAQKALDWRAKYGDKVKGGLAVGWTRANQLAKQEPISGDTIKRMVSFFARHKGNQKVDPKFKDEPWRDAGQVAWLLWGGDAGRDWANRMAKKLDKAKERRTIVRLTERRDLPPGAIGHIKIWVPRDTETGNLISVNGRQWDWESVVTAIDTTNEYISRNGNILRYLGHPDDGDPQLLGFKPAISIYKLETAVDKTGLYFYAWLLDCSDGLNIKQRLDNKEETVEASIVAYLDCTGIDGTGYCRLPDGGLLAIDILPASENPGIPGTRIVSSEKKCCSKCATGHPCCANQSKGEQNMSNQSKAQKGMPSKPGPNKEKAVNLKKTINRVKAKHRKEMEDPSMVANQVTATVDAVQQIAGAVADAAPTDIAAAILASGGMDMGEDMPMGVLDTEEDPDMMDNATEEDPIEDPASEGDDTMLEPEADDMMDKPAGEGYDSMKTERAKPSAKRTIKPALPVKAIQPAKSTQGIEAAINAAVKAAVDNNPEIARLAKEKKLAQKEEILTSHLTAFAKESGDLKAYPDIANNAIKEIAQTYRDADLTKISRKQLRKIYNAEVFSKKPKTVARASESATGGNTQPGLTVLPGNTVNRHSETIGYITESAETRVVKQALEHSLKKHMNESAGRNTGLSRTAESLQKAGSSLYNRMIQASLWQIENTYGIANIAQGLTSHKKAEFRLGTESRVANSGYVSMVQEKADSHRRKGRHQLAVATEALLGSNNFAAFTTMQAAWLVNQYWQKMGSLIMSGAPDITGGQYASVSSGQNWGEAVAYDTWDNTTYPFDASLSNFNDGSRGGDRININRRPKLYPATYSDFAVSLLWPRELFNQGQPYGIDLFAQVTQELMWHNEAYQDLKAQQSLINGVLIPDSLDRVADIATITHLSPGPAPVIQRGRVYGSNIAAVIAARGSFSGATPLANLPYTPLVQPRITLDGNFSPQPIIEFPVVVKIGPVTLQQFNFSYDTLSLTKINDASPDIATTPGFAFDWQAGAFCLNAAAAALSGGIVAAVTGGLVELTYTYATNYRNLNVYNSSDPLELNAKRLLEAFTGAYTELRGRKKGRRPNFFWGGVYLELVANTPQSAAVSGGQYGQYGLIPDFVNVGMPTRYIDGAAVAYRGDIPYLAADTPILNPPDGRASLGIVSSKESHVFFYPYLPTITGEIFESVIMADGTSRITNARTNMIQTITFDNTVVAETADRTNPAFQATALVFTEAVKVATP